MPVKTEKNSSPLPEEAMPAQDGDAGVRPASNKDKALRDLVGRDPEFVAAMLRGLLDDDKKRE